MLGRVPSGSGVLPVFFGTGMIPTGLSEQLSVQMRTSSDGCPVSGGSFLLTSKHEREGVDVKGYPKGWSGP